MKLSERLKKIPKEKLAIFITLIILLIASVTIITICAVIPLDEASEPVETEDTDELVVGVFNEITDDTSTETYVTADTETESSVPPETSAETTEAETTVETTAAPKDASGLNFKSNGDGTCSVVGIGSCEAIEIKIPAKSPDGETVTSIGDKAFEDCYEIMTLFIPASVKTIGTGAFRGCGGLSSIEVDALNPAFCSSEGVLYSKDKSVLVCYPQGRSGSKYLLPTSVKTISAYAFENALNLTGILYEGSIVKFQSIDVLAGNEKFSSLSITCNYSAS